MVENKLMEKIYFLLPTDGKMKSDGKFWSQNFPKWFPKFSKIGKKFHHLVKKNSHQFLKTYFFIGETCEGTNRSKITFLVAYFIPNKGEKIYLCEHYQETFSENKKLQRHLIIHSEEKPLTCKQYQKSFSENEILKRHLIIHSWEKLFTCKLWKKHFLTRVI